MSHERDLADQDVEEVAEELWTLGERGLQGRADLQRTTQVIDLEGALRKLAGRGLIREIEDRIELTPEGRSMAELQVRRHRLGSRPVRHPARCAVDPLR